MGSLRELCLLVMIAALSPSLYLWVFTKDFTPLAETSSTLSERTRFLNGRTEQSWIGDSSVEPHDRDGE